MATQVIPVPDIGGAEDVDVIEICVAVGDAVDAEQSLVVLESDKASMEVPSPIAGKVVSLKVKEGDKVSQGDVVVEMEVAAEAKKKASATKKKAKDTSTDTAAKPADPPKTEKKTPELKPVSEEKTSAQTAPTEEPTPAESEMLVGVPDIGGAQDVDVIEVCVAVGDEVEEGDSLIVLESEKSSMEIPSPAAGRVLSLSVAEGDKVSQADPIVSLSTLATDAGSPSQPTTSSPPSSSSSPPSPTTAAPLTEVATPAPAPIDTVGEETDGDVYAGPSVRKLARQLGVDLIQVKARGPRNRYTKDDIRSYVKNLVAEKGGPVTSGSGIPPIPSVDFAQFGDIELVKMSKIKKVTIASMTRNWLNVPHVTQFDEADVTELEFFRKEMKGEAQKRGVKLTPLPFLLKASAAALRHEPSFNASLHADGEHIVQKSYVHIGFAVATPAGLMVPVLRDVDKKGLWQLAEEAAELATKARDGKLLPRDMQGACFTISSLGAIGGTGFTPIVNAPEVAIMGVSKTQIKPVWNGTEFAPRQMLPLSVSYDHRCVNGADAGRFFTYLTSTLEDIRQLLL